MLKPIFTLFLMFLFADSTYSDTASFTISTVDEIAAEVTACKCGEKADGVYHWNVAGRDCCLDILHSASTPKFVTYSQNTGGTWIETTTTNVDEEEARACCPEET